MTIRRADFPLPDASDPRVAEHFAGAARGELVLPRCDACGRLVWYPAEQCAACGGTAHTWAPLSGRGTLFSWAVVRRAFLPAFAAQVPFVTGLVAVTEDPAVRVVSLIVDAAPDDLVADRPVAAVFRPLRFPTVPGREVTVPMFRPVG